MSAQSNGSKPLVWPWRTTRWIASIAVATFTAVFVPSLYPSAEPATASWVKVALELVPPLVEFLRGATFNIRGTDSLTITVPRSQLKPEVVALLQAYLRTPRFEAGLRHYANTVTWPGYEMNGVRVVVSDRFPEHGTVKREEFAAHDEMPLNSTIQIKSEANNRVLTVKVLDRIGSQKGDGKLVITPAVARKLGFEGRPGEILVSFRVLKVPVDPWSGDAE